MFDERRSPSGRHQRPQPTGDRYDVDVSEYFSSETIWSLLAHKEASVLRLRSWRSASPWFISTSQAVSGPGVGDSGAVSPAQDNIYTLPRSCLSSPSPVQAALHCSIMKNPAKIKAYLAQCLQPCTDMFSVIIHNIRWWPAALWSKLKLSERCQCPLWCHKGASWTGESYFTHLMR